jgi:glycosyltransferase involved in cell wall biosynthesis
VEPAGNEPPELVLLPSLKARQSANGGITLTRKFLEGATEYARTWPGPVTSIVAIKDEKSSDMDQVEAVAGDLETGLEMRPKDNAALADRLSRAAVVLAFLSPEETDTAKICHRMGIPVVFITEYTPKTEMQIAREKTRNPLRRLRRKLWISKSARQRVDILRNYSAGLQCSGRPTYDLYKSIAPDPLLFFDNRVRRADILDDTALAAKCDRLRRGEPLRLVFGGRLIAMKGVMDLPRVARALDRLQVPYHMDIYGSGDLEEALRADIAKAGLSDRVAMHPPTDFRTGWIPMLKEKADIFICCHPQGDPSSTYPEVMSCGVPIIGYDNEAFMGIVQESGAGRAVAIHDITALAKEIAQQHKDRENLCTMTRLGRDFAREHCFEATFDRRVEHLIRIGHLHDRMPQDRPMPAA